MVPLAVGIGRRWQVEAVVDCPVEAGGHQDVDARERIAHLLAEAKRGNVDPSDVHAEIERWGLFDEYQDRFLSLFKAR